MKHIIHDWSDAHCRTILDLMRAKLPPQGRVLLCEMVVTGEKGPTPAKLLDIEMLVVTEGGKERTEEEFAGAVRRFRLSPQPHRADIAPHRRDRGRPGLTGNRQRYDALVLGGLRRRRDVLPQLGRKPPRIDGEDLPRDGGLFALALPVVDHRVLVPDHRERNHFRVRLARAELAHGLGRRHLLVRLAADRAVALHASEDLAAHAAPHDGARGIDLGLLLRLDLVLAVERTDHPVRHRGPGVGASGASTVLGLTVGDGVGERLVGGLA